MRINSKQYLLVLSAVVGFGVAGGAAHARALPAPQENHDVDYSKNKNYQLGMHDGMDDQKHNRDHYKKRHFKKDDGQKAYESGYQQGHSGDHH